ncbi:hypothetical protein [Sinomonas halotolerans]|uniref:hypothetical protein n=1 Tax=Sinomonas halotolerans TaxID=1644133 RepID=UPI003D0236C6
MENLLPPLLILAAVAAVLILVLRLGAKRARASLDGGLAGGPEAAAAAAARLSADQHRNVYSLIARGQLMQAIAAYREATGVGLVEARNAVVLLDRHPQPYRPAGTAPSFPSAPGTGEQEAGEAAGPAQKDAAAPAPEGDAAAPGSPAAEGAVPEEAEAQSPTIVPPDWSGLSAEQSPTETAQGPAGTAPEAPQARAEAPGHAEPGPGVVPQEATAADAPRDALRPQRFPYRYRAIVSNGRETLEVASNMLNDEIYAEIKSLAQIGDAEDAAQLLHRHSDISIEEARAFVSLL